MSYKRRKRRRSGGGFTDAAITLLMIVYILLFAFKLSCNIRAGLYLGAAFAVGILVICFIISFISKSMRKRKYLNSRIHEIDHMTGIQFEELLAAHFSSLGYKVTLTKKSNDYGGDLIIKKDGITTVVQAKRYKSKVGISAVQEAYAAINHYGADNCMVVTNSYFTNAAVNLAEENNVELWDRDILTQTFKIKQ